MRTILVVDDDELFRWALKEAFELAGYRVLEAQDCAGARVGLGRRVDVAVLDHHLPDGTGFRLLRQINASDSPCPAIIVTAYPTDAGERKAQDDGAYAYIQKPENPQKVVEVVRAALSRQP